MGASSTSGCGLRPRWPRWQTPIWRPRWKKSTCVRCVFDRFSYSKSSDFQASNSSLYMANSIMVDETCRGISFYLCLVLAIDYKTNDISFCQVIHHYPMRKNKSGVSVSKSRMSLWNHLRVVKLCKMAKWQRVGRCVKCLKSVHGVRLTAEMLRGSKANENKTKWAEMGSDHMLEHTLRLFYQRTMFDAPRSSTWTPVTPSGP